MGLDRGSPPPGTTTPLGRCYLDRAALPLPYEVEEVEPGFSTVGGGAYMGSVRGTPEYQWPGARHLSPQGGGGGRRTRALDADPHPVPKGHRSASCQRRRHRKIIFFAVGGGKNAFSSHVSTLKILRNLWRIQSCMKIMKKFLDPPPFQPLAPACQLGPPCMG